MSSDDDREGRSTVLVDSKVRPTPKQQFGPIWQEQVTATSGVRMTRANREVLVVSTTAALTGEPGTACRYIDNDLRRGVDYRILVPSPARDGSAAATRLAAFVAAGAQVRTAPDIPVNAVVRDRAFVVLSDPRQDVVAVSALPGVVRTSVELFERIWAAAVTLTCEDQTTERDGLTWREQQLLVLLSAGHTDESAAVRLTISVRTVRRMMAAIMDRLGARSRFEAGVKAADRGWLANGTGPVVGR